MFTSLWGARARWQLGGLAQLRQQLMLGCSCHQSRQPGNGCRWHHPRKQIWLVGNVYMYIYIYISTYLHIYISTYLHIYISTYLHIYISTYLHIYISTYLHIYISTHLHSSRERLWMVPSKFPQVVCYRDRFSDRVKATLAWRWPLSWVRTLNVSCKRQDGRSAAEVPGIRPVVDDIYIYIIDFYSMLKSLPIPIRQGETADRVDATRFAVRGSRA